MIHLQQMDALPVNIQSLLPFDSLQVMKLFIKVEFAIAGNGGIIAIGIREAIRKGTPAAKILKEVREMAQDNFNCTADLLGKALTNKILSL